MIDTISGTGTPSGDPPTMRRVGGSGPAALDPRPASIARSPAAAKAPPRLRIADVSPLSPAQRTRLLDGLTYDAYLAQMAAALRQPDSGNLHRDTRRDTVRLNYKRTLRAHRTYVVPPRVRALAARIVAPQTWMLLTEGWCGDSAQTLPYIVEIARTNPLIDVRVLLRDANPDIMDLYETDGKRCIPIVAAFDTYGKELFRWGPRPIEAAALFVGLRAAGVPKAEVYPKLHLWYGRNRGEAVTREFVALLGTLGDVAVPPLMSS